MTARIVTLLSLSALALFVVAVPLHGDPIIYHNGLPNAAEGNEATMWIQAEDFTLTVDTFLTDVHFWAFELDTTSYQGSVHYRIYGNDALNTEPDETNILTEGLVVPTRVFDHNTPFGPSHTYDFTIAPLGLAAGTYWLGLHNGPLTITDRLEWYWETTDLNATQTGHEDMDPFDSDGWFENGQEHAFYLTGDDLAVVPEPASLLLLGTGAAALLARARRRRQAQSVRKRH